MRDPVSEWQQDGNIFVWRYSRHSRHAGEWHFTGDPAGCRSICNLIDRMAGSVECHRTWRLGPVTHAIWKVPGFSDAKSDRFGSMRVVFEPDATDLTMQVDGERLILTLGNERLSSLRAAFAEVEVGMGDFSIPTSNDRMAKSWWFWWLLSSHRK